MLPGSKKILSYVISMLEIATQFKHGFDEFLILSEKLTNTASQSSPVRSQVAEVVKALHTIQRKFEQQRRWTAIILAKLSENSTAPYLADFLIELNFNKQTNEV